MLIKGGRLVDPSQRIDAVRDIRLLDGIVTEIAEHLHGETSEECFDATGMFVAPGFIDMHVHLREPGSPEKETIATGTAAAVAGGFSAVACMPNTNPAIDDPDVVRQVRSMRSACRLYVIAAITQGRRGQRILDYTGLAAAGAVAFSDDGNTVADARVLRDAARAARGVRGRFISHCEDACLKGSASMHEGNASRRLGIAGSPGVAEDAIVARDLLIAHETQKAWHVAHVTTRISVELVTAAKARGVDVTCEVTPHHLVFTDEQVAIQGAAAKVNPPLRGEQDAAALRTAVREGNIDAFATDHAPHTAAEKSGDLYEAAVGFSGLEIALGAYAYALPDLPVSRFVELLSTNPARLLGEDGGTLRIGTPGDVTIFADRAWRVDPATFHSKGRSTPFAGMVLPRRAIAVFVGGKCVSQAHVAT
ncbi:MAG: dihydroorotase [Candidatus Eremiobacteraeota bacterium]|nr:dihydroorotase [Candidatus Eremiobacteraeota bacterium]